MSDQTKRKYEKPIALDTGSAASVLGARCSPGVLHTDGCVGWKRSACCAGVPTGFDCDL